MGQAKQRGTFDERNAAAVERYQKQRMAMAEVARRRPSPKHVALIGMIAAMTQGHNAKLNGARSASDLSAGLGAGD